MHSVKWTINKSKVWKDKAKRILQAGPENPLNPLSELKTQVQKIDFHLNPGCIWTNSTSSNESMKNDKVTTIPQNTRPPNYALHLINFDSTNSHGKTPPSHKIEWQHNKRWENPTDSWKQKKLSIEGSVQWGAATAGDRQTLVSIMSARKNIKCRCSQASNLRTTTASDS